MEETKKKLGVIVSVMLIIYSAVLLYFRFIDKEAPLEYSMVSDDMAYELLMVSHVSPDEAMELMWDTSVVFVDLRQAEIYRQNHIENAVNIPADMILDTESLELFDQWKNDSLRVVIYSANEPEATNPWMILYQLGYTNTQVLMGGMNYIDALYSDAPPEGDAYNVEAAMFDYSGIIEAVKNTEPGDAQTVPQRKVVVRKKQKKAAEGGC